jgi:MFS family permease
LRRDQAEGAGRQAVTVAAPSGRAAPSPWAAALAGAVALAVAMGIGRFAFTPLLPMMLADGVIDLHAASWLASANYLGYLAGALLCTFEPWIRAHWPRLPPADGLRIVRAGLVATGVLTLGMALPLPAAWSTLRFLAGVASAGVFVYGSAWCLALLARSKATALGGAMFAGPGAGIVLSGALVGAMVVWDWRAASGWVFFGLLAFALSASVWPTLREPASATEDPRAHAADATNRRAQAADLQPAAPTPAMRPHPRAEVALLAAAYGLAGFGYIVTATFLPVIAREALPGSPWIDAFWPIFGLGVVVGALLTTRLKFSGDLRLLLAAAYAIQAAAILAGIWQPTLAGFALGSLVLGLPFTAITFFALQEVRRLRPASPASTMGLLTVLYGTGQIVGPPLASRLIARSANAGAGFTLALEIAASALIFGALTFVAMTRAYPKISELARE